jgi:hypothetical protein
MHLFKRRPSDPIEQLLESERPEPRAEFARSLLARLENRSKVGFSLRARPAGTRLFAATGLTALALVGATAAAGGVGAASHGIVSIANVSHTFDVHSSKNDSKTNGKDDESKDEKGNKNDGDNDGDDNDHEGSGDHQYKVKICHKTHSEEHPYVELTLSPQGAAEHLAHHHGDFLAPAGGCPRDNDSDNHGKHHDDDD